MPCYNRAHDLLKTLRAYDQQDIDEFYELIAVDDASSDQTLPVLNSYQPANYNLRVNHLEMNSGPAAARNQGIALAQAPIVLIVGDDIVPDRMFVKRHLAAHRHFADNQIAILGQVVWPTDLPVNTLMAHIDGVGAQQFSYYYLRNGQEYDFRHFYTANISIKKKLLDQLTHYFDTDFPYAAFEDAEIGYRLKKLGLRIIYLDSIIGQHYHYHTIWTFSERQRKSGMMVNILIRKHPQLIYFFRAQIKRITKLFLEPGLFVAPHSITSLDQVENSACQLASFYEWSSNELLDQLYLQLLDYFYYDGVIQTLFSSTKLISRYRIAHARKYLLPSVREFINSAKRVGLPVPFDNLPDIAK